MSNLGAAIDKAHEGGSECMRNVRHQIGSVPLKWSVKCLVTNSECRCWVECQ